MRALAVYLSLAGLAACNQAFDLERTQLVDAPPTAPPDFDHDGVPDGVDNCELTANPDQLDGDADGFGEACDFCPAMPTAVNHDEDGDSRGDDCDVCPAIPDFQDDADGNGIGDACSTAQPTVQRTLFEPFITLDDMRWRSSATPWVTRNDAAAPASALQASDTGLQLLSPILSGSNWRVSVGFVSTRHWADGDRFGVVVTDGTTDSLFVSCIVSCVGSTCSETMSRPVVDKPVLVNAGPTTSIQVVLVHDPNYSYDYVYCGFNQALYTADTVTIPANAKVYLVAMPDLPASFVEIVN